MPFPVDKIRALCKLKNTSLAQLERELGIGNGVIARWENAKGFPPYDRLSAIAEKLGVTVEELADEKKDNTPTPAPDIGFDDFTYAMQNESRELSPEAKDRLLQMARFFAEEEKKKGR